jgi:hypothetical protein
LVSPGSTLIAHKLARTLEDPIVPEGEQLSQEQMQILKREGVSFQNQVIAYCNPPLEQRDKLLNKIASIFTAAQTYTEDRSLTAICAYRRSRPMFTASQTAWCFPEGSALAKFLLLFASRPEPYGEFPILALARSRGLSFGKLMKLIDEAYEVAKILTFSLPRPIDRIFPPKPNSKLAEELRHQATWLKARINEPPKFCGRAIARDTRETITVVGDNGQENISIWQYAREKSEAYQYLWQCLNHHNPLLEGIGRKGRLAELERIISPDGETPPPLSAVRQIFAEYVNYYPYPGPSTSQFNALQQIVAIRSLANREDVYPDDLMHVYPPALYKRIGILPTDSVDSIIHKLDDTDPETVNSKIAFAAGFRHIDRDLEAEARYAAMKEDLSPPVIDFMESWPDEVSLLGDPVTRRRFIRLRALLSPHMAKPGMPNYQEAEDQRQVDRQKHRKVVQKQEAAAVASGSGSHSPSSTSGQSTLSDSIHSIHSQLSLFGPEAAGASPSDEASTVEHPHPSDMVSVASVLPEEQDQERSADGESDDSQDDIASDDITRVGVQMDLEAVVDPKLTELYAVSVDLDDIPDGAPATEGPIPGDDPVEGSAALETEIPEASVLISRTLSEEPEESSPPAETGTPDRDTADIGGSVAVEPEAEAVPEVSPPRRRGHSEDGEAVALEFNLEPKDSEATGEDDSTGPTTAVSATQPEVVDVAEEEEEVPLEEIPAPVEAGDNRASSEPGPGEQVGSIEDLPAAPQQDHRSSAGPEDSPVDGEHGVASKTVVDGAGKELGANESPKEDALLDSADSVIRDLASLLGPLPAAGDPPASDPGSEPPSHTNPDVAADGSALVDPSLPEGEARPASDDFDLGDDLDLPEVPAPSGRSPPGSAPPSPPPDLPQTVVGGPSALGTAVELDEYDPLLDPTVPLPPGFLDDVEIHSGDELDDAPLVPPDGPPVESSAAPTLPPDGAGGSTLPPSNQARDEDPLLYGSGLEPLPDDVDLSGLDFGDTYEDLLVPLVEPNGGG